MNVDDATKVVVDHLLIVVVEKMITTIMMARHQIVMTITLMIVVTVVITIGGKKVLKAIRTELCYIYKHDYCNSSMTYYPTLIATCTDAIERWLQRLSGSFLYVIL